MHFLTRNHKHILNKTQLTTFNVHIFGLHYTIHRWKAKMIVVENMMMNILISLKNKFSRYGVFYKTQTLLPSNFFLNCLFTKIKHLYLNSNTKFLLLDTYTGS